MTVEHHPPHSTPERGARKGRRLIDKPRIIGSHEEPASYWELFSDLLMVAAASSLAEVFEEEPNLEGWLQFALLYLIFCNGWLLYTHHYTARFDDSSLVHSCILFFYYLGMAGCIVNADLESYIGFSYSAIFQRVAFIVLFIPVYMEIRNARPFVTCLVSWEIGSALLFLVAALGPEEWFIYLWVLAAILGFSTEVMLGTMLKADRLIPVNIEHTKERLGVLVLIMLGETVITSTITYKASASKGSTTSQAYYTVLTLSFLLIFMFTLLFFNMQPAPKDHGLRRSRLAGSCLFLLNKLLGLSLLTIGACMKLCVNAVVEEEHLSPFVAKMLQSSVGASLVLLFGMRICHYGGKIPRPSDPPRVRTLCFTWWGIFAIACLVPFLSPCPLDPILALIWPSCLVMTLCVVESWFTHVLEAHLPSEDSAPLYSATPTHYQSIPSVEN